MEPNDGVLANHMQSVNDEHEQIDDFMFDASVLRRACPVKRVQAEFDSWGRSTTSPWRAEVSGSTDSMINDGGDLTG